MAKSSKKKTGVKKITQFEIIRPNVAGIDVSDNGGMLVAYPVSSTEVVIEEFECYTRDLHRLSDCFKMHGIESVAMESTGVYWIPLFLLLQEDGFEVYLVNAKHVKNVTGRKDDEGDAEWIQKLHRCGLLSASFQPDNQTRILRSIVRHRSSLVKTRSTYLNRMQKALELMNLKMHTVISDIDGKSGLLIINAIVDGERNAEKLADLCDPRIKASREEVIKSLEGFWSDEHLFELSQCFKLFKFHNEIILECDMEIEKILQQIIASKNHGVMIEYGKIKKGDMASDTVDGQAEKPVISASTVSKRKSKKKVKVKKLRRKRNYKSQMPIDVTNYLYEVNGVDMTSITGISELSALTIYSEVGNDLSCFKNEKHFTSWLGLAPNTKISGGKIISSRVPPKKHYGGQAFRMAAMSLRNNKDTLGEYYRRIRATAGAPKAIVALARKLAIIYFRMFTSKEEYNPQALKDYQNKYKEIKIKRLEKQLAKLKIAV